MEREQDTTSEIECFPGLFAPSIEYGLTWPTIVFDRRIMTMMVDSRSKYDQPRGHN